MEACKERFQRDEHLTALLLRPLNVPRGQGKPQLDIASQRGFHHVTVAFVEFPHQLLKCGASQCAEDSHGTRQFCQGDFLDVGTDLPHLLHGACQDLLPHRPVLGVPRFASEGGGGRREAERRVLVEELLSARVDERVGIPIRPIAELRWREAALKEQRAAGDGEREAHGFGGGAQVDGAENRMGSPPCSVSPGDFVLKTPADSGIAHPLR